MEIVLLILGVVLFAASFVIPEKTKKADQGTLEIGEEQVKEIIDGQMKEAKEKLQDTVDETLSYAVEKSERSLERISNEKITAVSEFSETVLEDIHKSHQEVMFLYDMLHDKQKNLRETAKEVDRTSAIAKETKHELENAAKMYQEELVQDAREPEEKAEPVLAEPFLLPEVDMENISGGNNNDRILEMHKQGKSNVAIAKELGLGVGEVKLVIDLFEVI